MAGIKTAMVDCYCCAEGLGSAVFHENLEVHKCLVEKLEELSRPEQMWAGCVGAVAPCFFCVLMRSKPSFFFLGWLLSYKCTDEVQTFFLFLGCLLSYKSVVA